MAPSSRRKQLGTITILTGVLALALGLQVGGDTLRTGKAGREAPAANRREIVPPARTLPVAEPTMRSLPIAVPTLDWHPTVSPASATERARRSRERAERDAARRERQEQMAAEVMAAERASLVGRVGGLMSGLAVASDRAFTVVGDELLVLGAAEDGRIEIRARAPGVGDGSPGIVVVGDHVYVASVLVPASVEEDEHPETRLLRYALDPEGRPRFDGVVLDSLGSRVRSMAADETRIALSVGDRIVVVDVSDPGHARVAGEIPRGHADAMVWSEDLLYVTSRGVRTFDLRDPSTPVQTGAVLEEEAVIGLAVGEGVGYAIGCWKNSRMWVLDLENPHEPSVIEGAADGLDIEDCEGARLVLDGERLWLASDGVVQVFDVSDPRTPRETGRGVAWINESGATVAVFENRLLAVDGFLLGASAYRLDDDGLVRAETLPLEPHGLTSVAPAPEAVEGALTTLIAVDASGLWVLDFTNTPTPTIRSRLPREALDSNARASDQPTLIGRLPQPSFPLLARIHGNRALVPTAGGITAIVDLSDLDAPRPLGRIALPGVDAAIRGRTAYVLSREGLFVVDISDPRHPVIGERLPELIADFGPRSLILDGDRAFVLAGGSLLLGDRDSHVLLTLDLGPADAPLTTPRVVDHAALLGQPAGMALVGDSVYVMTIDGLLRFDRHAAEPSSTKVRLKSRDGEVFHNPRLLGADPETGMLLVQDEIGLQTLDLTTLERRWVGSTQADPLLGALSVVFDAGRAYVPGAWPGLRVYDLDRLQDR